MYTIRLSTERSHLKNYCDSTQEYLSDTLQLFLRNYGLSQVDIVGAAGLVLETDHVFESVVQVVVAVVGLAGHGGRVQDLPVLPHLRQGHQVSTVI